MSSFTSGEWVVQKGLTAGKEVIAPDAPKSKRVIARCGGPDRDGNAVLLAAAPKLLAALEGVVAIADRDTEEFNTARAIIAKAKGITQ